MPSRLARFSTDDDPLARAIAPPPNESPVDRQARILAEQEAKKISDAIDEELNRQRQAEKKGQKPIKVLLLGQSESGKSTTLKNFQLMNSPKAFRTERASWRAVIQLNVVRSICLILDAMSEAAADSTLPLSNAQSSTESSNKFPELSAQHLRLKMRLAPLFQVEEALLRRLNPHGSSESEATYLTPLTNVPYTERVRNVTKEVSVNSSSPWKGAFNRLMTSRQSIDGDAEWSNPKDPAVVLSACADDMIQLWNDPVIKKLLAVRKLRLEEMPGFFLDCLDRVTSVKYVPSDDDILRARLKTLGVTEYRFMMKSGVASTRDWRVFDVGGQRSLRAAWVPFFDDMDAIIFLAPISCFDQVLAEDDSVNRLEDSVLLWKSVVSNPLLKNTNIVLFLNKCDILKQKLRSGIRFADFVVSYAERPNDFESASNYLKKKFAGIQKEYSTAPRVFYCHLTSVTDTTSTIYILNNVQDMVLRQNLRDVSLMA